VLLWRGADGVPVEPLPDGTSEPVKLEAGPEHWITFPFRRPPALDPATPLAALPWLALVVSRGEITWALGTIGSQGMHTAQIVNRGPPAGPWRPLPQPFLATTESSPFAALRGRLRLRGRAAEDAPLAPLQVGLAEDPAQTVGVTPTQRGVRAALRLSPPLAADAATLRVVSHVEGTVRLSEVDIIATG
jgi:hypothetical protein